LLTQWWGIQDTKLPCTISSVAFTTYDNGYLSFPVPLYEEKRRIYFRNMLYTPVSGAKKLSRL
jgi:hypothetical protein